MMLLFLTCFQLSAKAIYHSHSLALYPDPCASNNSLQQRVSPSEVYDSTGETSSWTRIRLSCKAMATPGIEVEPWCPWPHTNLLPPQGPPQHMGMKKTTPTLSPFGSSESGAAAVMGRARVQRSHWQKIALVLSPVTTGRVTKMLSSRAQRLSLPHKEFSMCPVPLSEGNSGHLLF